MMVIGTSLSLRVAAKAAGLLALTSVSMSWAASPPTITALPSVSSSIVVADGGTPYGVTITASDADGYNSIRLIRVLFDHSEAGGDPAQGRGYLGWGKTDADVTQWGGIWAIADAAGGGRWGYCIDSWGGTTYITPLACTTATSGKATGGSGTRTVTWTFTAKSAWAFNPVLNDADALIADGVIGGRSYVIGWIDGKTPFDVVSAPCLQYCATPQAPVLSNATQSTIDVAIHPGDSSLDVYAILVSPNVGGRMYVQADGSLGTAPRWYARDAWGTRTVRGLLPRTTYTFAARASKSEAGRCPSDWGPGAQLATGGDIPIINLTQGQPFSSWVRGQCPYRCVPLDGYAPLWDLTIGSLGRGVAGGLDADTYDWRDIDSGMGWGIGGGQFTALEFLQHARDHQAVPLITANAFGGGYRDWTRSGVFVCQTVNPDGLAADWVRYTNFILPNYRQGDEGTLTGEDLRVYNSIVNWGGKARLLTSSEGSVPHAQYWEIGNEPEVPSIGNELTDHYLSPTDYRDRYKLISQAMLAVDSTVKLGPCLTAPSDPAGSGQWLSALAADPAARLDFVGYHPYYSSIKGSWGFSDEMATGLRDYRAFLNGKSAGIRAVMSQHGRVHYGLIASEWNPVNWDSSDDMQASMANALGVVETCFTFAEDGVLAGTFWQEPQSRLGVSGAFAGLTSHMGNVLIATGAQIGYAPADANFRIYVTRNQGRNNTIMIWGLNFDDSRPVTVNLGLSPCCLVSATLKRYGRPGDDSSGGDTSLTTSTGMAWDERDVTAGFDPANFTFTMEDAEVTLLILQLAPLPDFDADGDVDLADFSVFQYCFTGPNQPIRSSSCDGNDLDADADVDLSDFAIFQTRFNGPNRSPKCE